MGHNALNYATVNPIIIHYLQLLHLYPMSMQYAKDGPVIVVAKFQFITEFVTVGF